VCVCVCVQKLEQRAKKSIELRGEYVEYIPSLVTVASFLPGRAKDLSVPPCITDIKNECSYEQLFLNRVEICIHLQVVLY
jgi:hypothetical protein